MLETLMALVEWLQANPRVSVPVFVVVFTAVMTPGVPGGNFLLLASGFLFGPLLGAAASTIGALLAAWLTWKLTHGVLHDRLEARAEGLVQALKPLAARHNALLLVVPRFIPVLPFFAVNVGLAVAGVPLRPYLLSTLAGMAPMAWLVASIGHSLRSVEELSRVGMLNLLREPGFIIPVFLLLALNFLGWLWMRRRAPADQSGRS